VPRILLALGALLALTGGPVLRAAAAIDDLYQARAFVTGQGETERARGFALCLEDVLVKLSGDPDLAADPRLAALKTEAGRLVSDFHYHDRMSGIPVHDEQGTRDRPFDLFVSFDRTRTDAALRGLGHPPWLGPRPRVLILLAVQDAQVRYVLASDSERGLGQRQSFAAAAERRAIPILLPSAGALTADAVTYERIAEAPGPPLADLATALGGEVALAGKLTWSEAALGWTADWRLSWQGQEHHWSVAGVSFDDAFRNAIDGAARVLSAAAPAK
jgi:uncharacterized protein